MLLSFHGYLHCVSDQLRDGKVGYQHVEELQSSIKKRSNLTLNSVCAGVIDLRW